MFLIANIRLINRSNEALTILKLFRIVYRKYFQFQTSQFTYLGWDVLMIKQIPTNTVGSKFINYCNCKLNSSSESIKVVICDLQVKFITN